MKTYRVFAICLFYLLICSGLAQARQIMWNVGTAGAPVFGDADTLTGSFDQIGFVSQTSTIQFDTDGNGSVSIGDRIHDAGDLRVRNLLASGIIDQEGLNQFGGYEVTSRWSNVEGYVTGVTLNPTTGVTQVDVRYTSGTLNLYLDTSLDSNFANPAGTSPPAGAGGTGFENGTLIATLVVKDGIGHTFINFNGGAVANQGSAELLLEFTFARNGFWLDGTGSPLDFTGSVVTALIDMNLDTPTQTPGGPSGVLYTAHSNQDGSILVESAQCFGKIGDYVWLDANRNGVQDAGEMGIDGVQVILVDSQGNLKSTTTFTGGPNNAPGFYQFDGLCAGSYRVSIDRPNSPVLVGLFESPVGQGGDAATDSNDHTGTPVTLADNSTDTTIDFGYFSPCTGKIGDYVWLDTNRDGIQNDGSTGINGVTVILDDGVNPVKTATTFTGGPNNTPGYYIFEGLCADNYTIMVDPSSGPLAGLVTSPTGNGTPDTDSNDPTGTNVTLPTDNSTNVDTDFGYYSPCSGKIGDYVWLDINRDGIQNDGETGINGVTVILDPSSGPSMTITTFTGGPNNAPGYYVFDGLCAGAYSVRVDPNSGPLTGLVASPNGAGTAATDSNTPNGTPVSLLNDNTEDLTIDFGYYSPCSGQIGDYVWFDLNANGIQDDGNTGMDGVTVILSDGINPPKPTTTFTGGPNNAPGYYIFNGLCAGSYTITVDPTSAPLAGSVASPLGQGTPATDSDDPAGTTVILPTDSTSDVTIDFGYYKTVCIGDFVWNDLNGNGVQDGGEPGLNGITVNLLDCAGNVLATTITSADNPEGKSGYYQFCGLMPFGSYKVQFVAPGGYTFSPANQGDDSTDSDVTVGNMTDCITLTGTDNNTVDAGLYLPSANLGDKVWNDANQNGIQDAGEAGIPGVTVTLYNCDGTPTGMTDITDANGIYGFTNLAPGSYYVVFSNLPMGYIFTTANAAGSTELNDSDANGAGVTNCVTLAPGETNNNLDGGAWKPMPSIDIEKFTNGDDADMPTGPKVSVGGTVTWTYEVTNTGNVELTGVAVTDDKLGAITCPKTVLAPMESMTCTKTGTAVMGQYANMGKVTGQYNGTPVDDQDPSHYYGVKASIDIEKYTNGEDADNPTGPKIPVGGMVEWKYVVTNTGNQELINVAVTDDKLGAISCPKTTLAPMESMTCIRTGTAVMGQYANMGTVTGQYNGTTVTDKDPSHYYGIPACVPCQDGVTWMQLKLNFHQYPSYSPYDRIRVRADSLTGEILYDSKYDSVSTTGLPVGAIFSFNVPPSAKTVVVTVQGKYHTYETVKATFSAECELLIGTISGNTYIKFKVEDAKFDGEMSCTPKTPDIDVEKYVSNDGGKTWHDADDAPGLSVPLCSQAPPPPPEPTCGACSGGITELTLLYKGYKSVKVVVKDSKGNQLFSNTVYPNKTFTVKGTGYSGTMGSYIKIYIGSTVNTTINTDCSKSIYPGMTSGSFTVASGSSKNGGELCDKTSTSSSTSYSSSSSTTTSWWWSSSSYSSYTKDDDDDDRNSYDGSDYDKAYSDSCGTIPVYSSCKVQFKYVVKNTGNADLTNITLTDNVYDLSGKCTIPASLAPGASFSCTIGPFAAEAGQHTNTATVTGKYNGFEVSDSDKANYYGGKPATGCVRSPGYWKTHPEAWPVQTIVIGGVTYSKTEAIILMEKPVAGDKTFTLFPALVSAKLNVLSGADATCISDIIASADSWMAQYPVGSGVTGSSSAWDNGEPLYMKLDKYNNGYLCASYCGDQNPPPTSYPKISIDKYTNGYDADMAPGPYIWIGDQVKWTYVIKNTGNTTLSSITVSDDKVSSISCPKSSLMSGESMTCTATGIAVEGQYENTGCVVGYASGNVKVSDCDLSHYYGKEKQTQTSCGTGTPGYWKNHPEAWPVSSITIGGTSYSKAQAISIMAKSVSGDKTYTMFPALVSAKLNVMVGNNSSCISSTISAADAWMKTYKLDSGVTGSGSAWKQGEPYYWALDNYNNGLLCAPHRDSASSSCSSSVPSEWFN